jgi:hypothetical protein
MVLSWHSLCSLGARTVDGTLVLNGQSAGDDWQMVDLLGSPATSVTISFDQLFKLFRGERFCGELEALGNTAAKTCNRTHRNLPSAHQLCVSRCRLSPKNWLP